MQNTVLILGVWLVTTETTLIVCLTSYRNSGLYIPLIRLIAI